MKQRYFLKFFVYSLKYLKPDPFHRLVFLHQIENAYETQTNQKSAGYNYVSQENSSNGNEGKKKKKTGGNEA